MSRPAGGGHVDAGYWRLQSPDARVEAWPPNRLEHRAANATRKLTSASGLLTSASVRAVRPWSLRANAPSLDALRNAVKAMSDTQRLLDVLAAFTQTLTRPYSIGDVLHDLAERVSELLGLTGAGVTLVQNDRVQFVTAQLEAIADLERTQEAHQAGPGVEAIRTRQAVTVCDLSGDGPAATRWPEYSLRARAIGVRAVAGIPMVADDRVIGAVNLYEAAPRHWSSQDLTVARVMADMATGYLVHASALDQQRRTCEQLRQALETRIVIEQAKGILSNAEGISVDAAFRRLRKHARDHNARIHDVAYAVVNLGLRPGSSSG
jgi:GAF domain-containing protein